MTEAVVHLLSSLHRVETWKRVLTTDVVERLSEIITYMQKKGATPHELVCSKLYNGLWSALTFIAGYDRGLQFGSRYVKGVNWYQLMLIDVN